MPETIISNLREMVADWLRSHGYDGLWNGNGACACKLDDLMPCDEPSLECQAGYLQPCVPETCENGGECGFHIGAKGADHA